MTRRDAVPAAALIVALCNGGCVETDSHFVGRPDPLPDAAASPGTSQRVDAGAPSRSTQPGVADGGAGSFMRLVWGGGSTLTSPYLLVPTQRQSPWSDVSPTRNGLSWAALMPRVRAQLPLLDGTCDASTPAIADPYANVEVRIDTAGKVSDASAAGNDPGLMSALERGIRAWTFPSAAAPSTIVLPLHCARGR